MENNNKNLKNKIYITVFITISILFSLLTLNTSFKNWVTQKVFPTSRSLIAKVTFIYPNADNTQEYLILKIKDQNGIIIEIYENLVAESRQVYKQSFQLTQDTDAYLTIDKNTTNLALSDVDQDGLLDILAPTVDRNGNLRLNTFKFNADLQLFQAIENKNL